MSHLALPNQQDECRLNQLLLQGLKSGPWIVFGEHESLAESLQYANTDLCEIQLRTQNDTFEF